MRAELAVNTLSKSFEYVVQVDCYGLDASEQTLTISTVIRSAEAEEFLSNYDVEPLYDEDAIYAPLVNGEDQYEERWTMRLHLQYNPVVRTVAQFMDSAVVTSIETDNL